MILHLLDMQYQFKNTLLSLTKFLVSRIYSSCNAFTEIHLFGKLSIVLLWWDFNYSLPRHREQKWQKERNKLSTKQKEAHEKTAIELNLTPSSEAQVFVIVTSSGSVLLIFQFSVMSVYCIVLKDGNSPPAPQFINFHFL